MKYEHIRVSQEIYENSYAKLNKAERAIFLAGLGKFFTNEFLTAFIEYIQKREAQEKGLNEGKLTDKRDSQTRP